MSLQARPVSAAKIAWRHFADYQRNPVPGTAIVQIDATTFHVSTTIQYGPYVGISVHWELRISNEYPFKPPSGRVVDGYAFDNDYHHHVFREQGICADFLSNFAYMHQSADTGTGWTSSCDFIGLMINMQVFFADPDGARPAVAEIAKLRKMDAKFKCEHCQHVVTENDDAQKGPVPMNDSDSPEKQRARKELFCTVTKANIIDDPDLCLGYPVKVDKDKFGRIHSRLFPEMLSYDAYMTEYQISASNGTHMRTSGGSHYTNWLPIYIDERRFQTNKFILTTTLSVIANGTRGKAENDFDASCVIRVFPSLMNQQIVALLKGDIFESESAIHAFVGLLRTFKRLLLVFPKLRARMVDDAKRFAAKPSARSKTSAGDIGEFLIKLAVLKDQDAALSYENTEMRLGLLTEYFARQIMWIPTPFTHDLKITLSTNKDRVDALQRVFDACKVSNQMLVFNLEMIRLFIIPGFEGIVDSNYGLAPEQVVQNFRSHIKKIKTHLTNHRVMVQAIAFHEVKSSEDLILFFRKAIAMSIAQGYTKY